MEKETLACSVDGCPVTFQTGEEYTTHMAEAHRQVSYIERPESVNQYNPESVAAQENDNAAEIFKTFQCLEEGCNAPTYHSAEGLAHHKRVCHKVVDHWKPFKCAVFWCGKAFQTNDLLQEHRKAKHPRAYAAEHPESVGPRRSVLDATGKYVYRCPEAGCEKSKDGYTGYRGLEFHMWSAHDTLFEKFKCREESCGEYFPGTRELKIHQAHRHGIWRCTGNRCSFQSSSADGLEAHVQERKHGENPKAAKTWQYAFQGKTSIVVDMPNYTPENSSKMTGLERLGVKEDIELGRLLECPSAVCDFCHADEWSIKEHWGVAHVGNVHPGFEQSRFPPEEPTYNISQPPRSRQLSEPRGDLNLSTRRSRAVTVGPSSIISRKYSTFDQTAKFLTPINKPIPRLNLVQKTYLGGQLQSPFTKDFGSHAMESLHAIAPLGIPFGAVDPDASSKNRRLGARKIAQLDIFNPDHGEDSRALKPTYRAPLPGVVKREKVVDPEEDTRNPLRVSPTTPALRRLMERIQSDVEKGRKPRKAKPHPDESDSDMSEIEDSPTASNFPRYGNPKPGFWIDDRVVMNYPEPPPPKKKKKKSGAAAIEEEIAQPNLDKYGGYPEPLKVTMNFFCNPKTLPISKIEQARMGPESIAKPGPPSVLPEAAGFAFGAVAKKRRATCTGPPRQKRKYQWKGGVAPKRRLGHVKSHWVEEEGEDDDDSEDEDEHGESNGSDDWSSDSYSVLDDSGDESVAEDVLMRGA